MLVKNAMKCETKYYNNNTKMSERQTKVFGVYCRKCEYLNQLGIAETPNILRTGARNFHIDDYYFIRTELGNTTAFG